MSQALSPPQQQQQQTNFNSRSSRTRKNQKSVNPTSVVIFIYYLIYKFIEQHVFIDIIRNNTKNFNTTEILSRVLALSINLLNTIVLEVHFSTQNIKKIILSVYTSLLVILLYIFKDIDIYEITFFILNLTICEAILYKNFLRLWQIQLCLELSIFANYTAEYVVLTFRGNFIPLYILWICSILLANTRIRANVHRKHSRMSTSHSRHRKGTVTSIVAPSPLLQLPRESVQRLNRQERKQLQKEVLRKRIRRILFFFIQGCLLTSNILISCTTIRNNIFNIFDQREKFSFLQVVSIMLIILCITSCAKVVGSIKVPIKIFIIIALIIISHCLVNLIEHSNIVNEYRFHYIDFVLNITIKKMLGFCKCCIISIITHDSEGAAYDDNIKTRFLKFVILNTDTISFIINTVIVTRLSDSINTSLINIGLNFLIVVIYIIFRMLKHKC